MIPYLLLVGYAVAEQRNPWLSALFLATIVLHGVTHSFVVVSRGALAHAVLPVAIWVVLSGRLTRKSVVACILLLVTIAFVHRIVTNVPGQRLGGRLGTLASLRDERHSMDVTANIATGLESIGFRVQLRRGSWRRHTRGTCHWRSPG